MIETLCSAPASLDQENLVIPDLEITGITFAGGDLSQPRYPSLIDYSRAPAGVQFEPGIQMISAAPPQLTVLYRIDPSAGVIFLRDTNGRPVVQSVAAAPDFGPVPGLSAELLDPTTCQLTWNQAAAVSASTSLRILCEHWDRLSTRPELVDGGVYLTLVHRYEAGIASIPAAPGPVHEDETIEIRGTDSHGRPRYDLFHSVVSEELAPDLELEISFRVRQGETVQFDLLISVVPGSDVRFDTVGGQVVVQPARPADLQSTAASDLKERCTLVWETGQTTQGKVSSFFLLASDGEVPFEIFPERATARPRRVQLDPTVIQPPNCTSGGICITP